MKFFFLVFYNICENFIHIKRIKNFMKQNIYFRKPIIFDVGAHKGKMTKLFSSIYNDARIYCFEPNKLLINKLKELNKKIIIFNCAMGDKNENKKINLGSIDLTGSLSKVNQKSIYLKIKNLIISPPTKNLQERIKVIKLSTFCKKHKIKKIDFLKIDVEGYELMVLLGANQMIKNVKYIMIEIQKNDMYSGYSKEKIEKYLKKNNFELIKRFNFPFMFFQDCIYKRK